MLVLTRKPGERVKIGSDVFVEVVRIGKNRVQLGITAHRDVPVHREEVSHVLQGVGRLFTSRHTKRLS